MALFIGRAIDGKDVELLTSTWSGARFASLCNALVWAVSGRRQPTLPDFTDRVNVSDRGVDASWDVEMPDDGGNATPIVSPGWNVFQYKQRDVATGRRSLLGKLKTSLRGEVRNVMEEHPRQSLATYTLFVNIDLTNKDSERKGLDAALRSGIDTDTPIRIRVVAAEDIAVWLNDNPHLRSAYFGPTIIRSWQQAWAEHCTRALGSMDVVLVGREQALDELKALVDEAGIGVIVLIGQHGVGKRRLALGATEHRMHDIAAVSPAAHETLDIAGLARPQHETVILVDDAADGQLQRFIDVVLATPGLKLLATTTEPTNGQAIRFAADQRIVVRDVPPLDDADARQLLQATASERLDYELEHRIIEWSGGIPAVILAAARFGPSLRREFTSVQTFTEAVGREFEDSLEERLGAAALRAARLLAALSHVGVDGSFSGELAEVCAVLGGGLTDSQVREQLDGLAAAGFLHRSGNFVSVTPRLLANHLAASLVRAHEQDLLGLFARLNPQGRYRLLERLAELPPDIASSVWHALLAHDGPLGNFAVAIRDRSSLELAADVEPLRVLDVLDSGLRDRSHAELLAIAGDQRRAVVETLEHLTSRLETSYHALELLIQLAAAENETWANNATGLLEVALHPMHSQTPLPLDERLALVRAFADVDQPKQVRCIVLKALRLVGRESMVPLRSSAGHRLLDRQPTLTWADVVAYHRGLLALLLGLGHAVDRDVAGAALGAVPAILRALGSLGLPEEVVEGFGKLVAFVEEGQPAIDVSTLASALDDTSDWFSMRAGPDDSPSKQSVAYREAVDNIAALKSRLDHGSYEIRVKRWLGRLTRDEHAPTGNPNAPYRYLQAISDLARQTIERPELLSDELINWMLRSGEAVWAPTLFFYLGQYDDVGRLRTVVDELGRQREGNSMFGGYWEGRRRRNRAAVAEDLAALLAEPRGLTPEATLLALLTLGPEMPGVMEQVTNLIRSNILDPHFAAQVLSRPDRLDAISPAAFAGLLHTFASTGPPRANAGLGVLWRWVGLERPLDSPVSSAAWELLAALSPAGINDEWYVDHVAATLARDDPERGLELLKKWLVHRWHEPNWRPLSAHGRNSLWNELHEADADRLLSELLELAKRDPETRINVTEGLHTVLDQVGDGALLLKLASDSENAQAIAVSLDFTKPGFWEMAFRLVERFPGDNEVQNSLSWAVASPPRSFGGSFTDIVQARAEEVERVAQEPTTPTAARTWLRELAARLSRQLPDYAVWEYDVDIHDLRKYIDDPDSPQRMWAIGRVLKYLDVKKVLELLSPEDIAEALPQVDLPERRRRAYELALPVWRNG